jgi:hypothetical protein
VQQWIWCANTPAKAHSIIIVKDSDAARLFSIVGELKWHGCVINYKTLKSNVKERGESQDENPRSPVWASQKVEHEFPGFGAPWFIPAALGSQPRAEVLAPIQRAYATDQGNGSAYNPAA